ncbi:MAG TPA: transcriptional regulator, partial [Phytomonospora sp.]
SVATVDPGAAGLAALVAVLTAASPEVTALWARSDVRKWTGRPKVFHHPLVGELSLTSETLTLPEGGRRLVVYQAEPGSPSAAALERLADGG